ncbi:serine/threonine protein phosphatase, putative [Eimeria necatrix]|uniref:Serine/threonine protein phosphatase, putative n=1 Tax=Eimeria necatrix TaxID=51315 RepID=U6MJZ5_9EIME|nr:serine/threonine protein phosphatase, putative [Eimeria necatrix]CDJ62784.1 serine/threonine protein phosphatase, putative [Eimeria necatrix]
MKLLALPLFCALLNAPDPLHAAAATAAATAAARAAPTAAPTAAPAAAAAAAAPAAATPTATPAPPLAAHRSSSSNSTTSTSTSSSSSSNSSSNSSSSSEERGTESAEAAATSGNLELPPLSSPPAAAAAADAAAAAGSPAAAAAAAAAEETATSSASPLLLLLQWTPLRCGSTRWTRCAAQRFGAWGLGFGVWGLGASGGLLRSRRGSRPTVFRVWGDSPNRGVELFAAGLFCVSFGRQLLPFRCTDTSRQRVRKCFRRALRTPRPQTRGLFSNSGKPRLPAFARRPSRALLRRLPRLPGPPGLQFSKCPMALSKSLVLHASGVQTGPGASAGFSFQKGLRNSASKPSRREVYVHPKPVQ